MNDRSEARRPSAHGAGSARIEHRRHRLAVSWFPCPQVCAAVVATLASLAPLGAQGFGGNELIGEGSRGVPTLLGETLDQMMMRASQNAIADPFFDASSAIQSLYPPGWQAPTGALPAFQGFPTLMPPGFGAYPGGTFPVPFETELELPPAPAIKLPRPPNSWPSWFPEEAADTSEFRAEVGILAQASDYVWIRETELRPFVPLAYWDRFRVVHPGAAVDVRGDGQFVIVFQEGARMRISGNTRMVIGDLIPEAIEIGFDEVSRVYALAADRPVRLRMGLAGVAELIATTFQIEREAGFVALDNYGPGILRFESPEGDIDVPPGHRIRVVMAGDADVHVDASLELRGGLEAETSGRELRIDGGQEGGIVEWSGARLRVPRGATLRLDPLAGQTFPENRVGATDS